MELFFGKKIGLVEDDDDWHSICLGTCQESVDEGGRCLWVIHRNHKQCLVYIGSQDMTLLAEIRRFTDDIVSAVFDGRDEGGAFLVGDKLHIVTHSHRICTADALQSEIAFYFTFNQLAIVGLDGVPAACILNNESSHYHLLIMLA